MKLLYTDNKIKISSSNISKEFNSFILCNDKELELLKSAGYNEVSEIYDIEEMRRISSNIDNKSELIELDLNKIEDIICLLDNKIDNLEKKSADLSKLLEEYSSKFNEYTHKMEIINDFYNRILSISENLNNKLSDFDTVLIEKTNKYIENYENFIEDTNDRAKHTMIEYAELENKLQKRFDIIIEHLKSFVSECKKYSEISRQWASNPFNVVVNDNLYSSRHYAEISKNNNK